MNTQRTKRPTKNKINKTLRVLAHAAHHDLKGGLDGLQFATELIQQSLTPEQLTDLGLAEPLELIQMEVDKQAAILSGLNDFLNLLRSGHSNKTRVNLTELAHRLMETTYYPGEVTVEELPTLEVSAGQLTSLFDNLIKNALNYNDKSKKQVRLYTAGHSMVIEDNGNGFPEEQFEQLCEPFERLEIDKPGTGMGMAIVKNICDFHQFGLRAESTLGVGTRILIDFQARHSSNAKELKS